MARTNGGPAAPLSQAICTIRSGSGMNRASCAVTSVGAA